MAGLIGVILLAIVYAKYKQYQKDKNGNTSKRPLGKQQSSTRCVQNIVELDKGFVCHGRSSVSTNLCLNILNGKIICLKSFVV